MAGRMVGWLAGTVILLAIYRETTALNNGLALTPPSKMHILFQCCFATPSATPKQSRVARLIPQAAYRLEIISACWNL